MGEWKGRFQLREREFGFVGFCPGLRFCLEGMGWEEWLVARPFGLVGLPRREVGNHIDFL